MNADAQLTVNVIRARGWQAVQLVPREKHPSGPVRWTVTKDAATVASWFEAGFNVGLVCHEATGIAVLDADEMSAWADMVVALGQPCLPWVVTGSGKLHYYVQWVADLPAKLVWDGAIIGEIQRGPGQQQIVLPGSVHPDTGEVYRWITPSLDPFWEPLDYTTAPLPALPEDWVLYLRGA